MDVLRPLSLPKRQGERMERKSWRCLLLLLLSLPGVLSHSPAGATPGPDDEFIAPLQAAVATPSSPAPKPSGRVRIIKHDPSGMLTLRARTAQDAIIAAIGQRSVIGCRMLRFSGDHFGWIVTGAAGYARTGNVALARREAHFKAFMDARMRLTACLRTLPLDLRRLIGERLQQDDAIRLALVNLATTDAERQEQALRIVARGFVAYAVEDDPAKFAIRVHLVTTPRTATRLTRPTAFALETASLAEGLKQTLAEVGGGLIPAVGNRLIVVNATGEMALIGYARHPVSQLPDDPAGQETRQAEAEQVALRSATEALTGLAIGDETDWQSGLNPTHRDQIQMVASGYDDGEPSARRFGHIRDLMQTQIKDDPGLQALREGTLPTTATLKRFSSPGMVTAVVIYAPSVKKREVTPPAQQPTLPATDRESAPTENR
ncbi:MAG: hypothetical protein HC889_01785 [Synechococcaceae cyanobacterium SM1_2_3]|nr:hypothetical protein [Synechococcaceae cyanobacterium SM1_2_3]